MEEEVVAVADLVVIIDVVVFADVVVAVVDAYVGVGVGVVVADLV